MDIQTQKLEFIKAYLEITNKSLLDRFQELLLETQQEELRKELFEPLTKDDLVNRALQAEKEIKNGEGTSLSELRKEKWS